MRGWCWAGPRPAAGAAARHRQRIPACCGCPLPPSARLAPGDSVQYYLSVIQNSVDSGHPLPCSHQSLAIYHNRLMYGTLSVPVPVNEWKSETERSNGRL